MRRVSRNRVTLLTLLALILAFQLNAQEIEPRMVLIHGVVFDASTRNPMANVHFLVSGSTGGATGADGKFSAWLYTSDTISFSYLGYHDFSYVPGDTLKGNSYVAGIFMKADTLSAGEVIVFPRLGDLRSEFRNSTGTESQELINAKTNLEIATYQGITNAPKLGDPEMNYELLKQKQVITAYEKGGIPSDRMIGLNFITLIPAAIYLLGHGLPEKPEPPAPYVSDREIKSMIEAYEKKRNNER